jgi:hypothetical protein
MRTKIIKYISVVVFGASLTACERVVDLNMPKGDALPYVDAWITDQPGVQTIKFLKAVEYMSSAAPEVVSDATITVTDVTAGKAYPFTYHNGSYNYDAGSSSIGVVGHTYKLSIDWKGGKFEATDELKRPSIIDSLTGKFEEEKDADDKAGYYAKLYAHDPVGAVDYCWVRTYRNGTLNYHVGEMLAADGSFGGDEGISDGFAFIPPFRDGVTSGEHPYEKGDVVKVLLRSLSKPSHQFIEQAQEQLTSGGMFAKVLLNVPANVRNLTSGSSTKIYGWFGTVAEVSATRKME